MIERRTTMHCLDCQYSLVGLESHRCPECGRKFEPRDPKSFARRIVNGRSLIARTAIGYSFLIVPILLIQATRIFDLDLLADFLGFSFLATGYTMMTIITVGPMVGWLFFASVVEKCVRVYGRHQCTAMHRGTMNLAFALSIVPASIPIVGALLMIGIVVLQIIVSK